MISYHIRYELDNKTYEANVMASNIKFARRKIARKHKLKTERKIKVIDVSVIGYF